MVVAARLSACSWGRGVACRTTQCVTRTHSDPSKLMSCPAYPLRAPLKSRLHLHSRGNGSEISNWRLRLRQEQLVRSCSSNRPAVSQASRESASPPRSSPAPSHSNRLAPGVRDDASLTRYPSATSVGGVLRGLDYAGTVTFAMSGTVTAAQSGLDVFGSSMVGVITAVGGGTVRDAVFLNRRPFWTEETEYIWMGLLTGVVTFFAWPSVLRWKREKQNQQTSNASNNKNKQNATGDCGTTQSSDYGLIDAFLDSLDAVGLSAFAIVGAQNGIRAGVPGTVSAICGMATSTFGGLTRDVLCGRPVRILHSTVEVYATPALAGAVVYLSARRMGGSPALRVCASIATCMTSRYVAVSKDIKLPSWGIVDHHIGVSVRKKAAANDCKTP